ncbi:MAG: ATP-dependent Clp protease ATP-binding subunit, partial [Deltaproteobacteria bacterium]|nr:ATP-dependent Clp protease ATP-binding subunit [Deltaproteobacteria bacterium]
YRKYIEKDGALERRFQTVMVNPPTRDEAYAILLGLRERYEAHHRIRYTNEALRACVELSSRYINGRFLPDKAIDVMDEAGARLRLRSMTRPPDLKHLDEEVTRLEREKEEAVGAQDFERAAQLRDSAQKVRRKKDQLLREWREEAQKTEGTVDEDIIRETLSKMTGVPLTKLEKKEAERLLRMEDELHKTVVSQDDAITAIAKALRRSRSGLKDPRRPMGSFIFAGPTGVGKTHLSKALAAFMFGDEEALIQIDMSEYMEKHTVSRLVGSPPGYVGYDEGGQLSEQVRRNPYSVILFDEVEKAHPDVFNLFLQLLDDGRLTDSAGNVVSFTNTIVLLTSNLGSEHIQPVETPEEQAEMGRMIMDAVRSHFRPEFINRLDDILIFQQLTLEAMRPITDIQLGRLQAVLNDREIFCDVDEVARDLLAEAGFNPLYGARPLQRVIQTRLQDPLAEKIIAGEVPEGTTVTVRVVDDELLIRGANTPEDDVAEGDDASSTEENGDTTDA